ncbi:MAG TPA: hypothetical protein VNO30_20600 [Kofleriaceae bacterium]|nr:hypothetical protein [Kofleriaceae bacterium]
MTARWLALIVVVCGCGKRGDAPDGSSRTITHKDLARWSEPGPRLGLDCLDEQLVKDLRSTHSDGQTPRTQIVVNPPLELVEKPNVLPIYTIEAADTDMLWLRNKAFTIKVELPRLSKEVSVIVVDRNLLRWMGEQLGQVFAGLEMELDRGVFSQGGSVFAKTILKSQRDLGGFGKPIPERVPSPEAVLRYCKKAPKNGDIITVALLRDVVLWTLRHEIHHMWNPQPQTAPSTVSCPSRDQLERMAKPEREADAFASRALEIDDLDGFIAPWRTQLDRWAKTYGNPGASPLNMTTRLAALSFIVAHHESDTIVAQQEWIATGRTRDMLRRAGFPSVAEGMDFNRAQAAAGRCPNWHAIEQQCETCKHQPGGCTTVAETAWSCNAMFEFDDGVAVQQDGLLRDAVVHLQSEDFTIIPNRSLSNNFLRWYNVWAGGSELARLFYVRGVRSPSMTLPERVLQKALYAQGQNTIVGGLMVIPSRRGAGSEAVLDAMYRWEFDSLRNRCREGDATSCLWEGVAYLSGEGTPINLLTARQRFAQACDAQIVEACDIDKEIGKELLELLRVLQGQ